MRLCPWSLALVLSRGGVEDTRLEAKAKDTKKIQGQGQPFRRQTLSRPRTGMLEAKDQGHKAQVLSKKKKKRSSQKFFKRSRKNAFQKIFQPLHKIVTFQKLVLSSSRGQANFRGLEASRPRPRTSKSVLEDSTSGLEHSYPWSQECLASAGLSLSLASDFFVSFALASSLVSSTPPLCRICHS